MLRKFKQISAVMLLSAGMLPLGTSADAMSLTALANRETVAVGTCTGVAMFNTASVSTGGGAVPTGVSLEVGGGSPVYYTAGGGDPHSHTDIQ